MGKESLGKESVGKESVGKESVGKESVGKESVGKESVGDFNGFPNDSAHGDTSPPTRPTRDPYVPVGSAGSCPHAA